MDRMYDATLAETVYFRGDDDGLIEFSRADASSAPTVAVRSLPALTT